MNISRIIRINVTIGTSAYNCHIAALLFKAHQPQAQVFLTGGTSSYPSLTHKHAIHIRLCLYIEHIIFLIATTHSGGSLGFGTPIVHFHPTDYANWQICKSQFLIATEKVLTVYQNAVYDMTVILYNLSFRIVI